MPTVPLSRPSVMTQRAPASISPTTSSAHSCGTAHIGRVLAADLGQHGEPRAARCNSSCFSSRLIGATPRETSTHGEPDLLGPVRQSSSVPWGHATSSRVPPVQVGHRRLASISSFAPGRRRGTRFPSRTSICRCTARRVEQHTGLLRGRPLSRTWVMPTSRGLAPRFGRSRNRSVEPRCLCYIGRPLSDRARRLAAWRVIGDADGQYGFTRRPGRAGRSSAVAPALRAKREIGLVSDVLGGGSWVHGPGDDGAVCRHRRAASVIVCGEALLPAFVAADPYGAGIAAVLTNVNDLAAMGARPMAHRGHHRGRRRDRPRGAARHEAGQ